MSKLSLLAVGACLAASAASVAQVRYVYTPQPPNWGYQQGGFVYYAGATPMYPPRISYAPSVPVWTPYQPPGVFLNPRAYPQPMPVPAPVQPRIIWHVR